MSKVACKIDNIGQTDVFSDHTETGPEGQTAEPHRLECKPASSSLSRKNKKPSCRQDGRLYSLTADYLVLRDHQLVAAVE